jgi:CBS domain-containing protein
MRVEEVMTRGVELAPAEATVQHAATLLAEHNLGALLIGSEQQLEGILTDRDIIIRVIVPGLDPTRVQAGEVMSSTLFTCAPDTELEAALEMMDTHQVRRLPVLAREGQLVGILTRSDITRALLGVGRGDPLPKPTESNERRPP